MFTSTTTTTTTTHHSPISSVTRLQPEDYRSRMQSNNSPQHNSYRLLQANSDVLDSEKSHVLPVIDEERFGQQQNAAADTLDEEVATVRLPFLNRTVEQKLIREGVIVALLIVLWYLSSAFVNNLNKQLMLIGSFPILLTYYHFIAVIVGCQIMFYCSESYSRQPINLQIGRQLILPLCVSQILAHYCTQLSLYRVPVSFTHTIKATSPIFAIALSRMFNFQEKYSMPLLLSIIPIIGGVVLSTATEVSFDTLGFFAALASTIIFAWQNAFSKKVFQAQHLDHVNLLLYTATFATFVMTPLAVYTDLPAFFEMIDFYSPRFNEIVFLTILNGICHFGQNIAAFTFMTQVSPLTYTVFNTFKRVFVIISAVLYFGNTIPFLNWLGISSAIFGVGMYNKAKFDLRQQQRQKMGNAS